MNETTRQQLISINREFYEQYADSFSSTRDHPWPGWVRVTDGLSASRPAVLDVGCGNGRLARFLHGARDDASYIGIDTSAALIDCARAKAPSGEVLFEVADANDAPAGPFDLVAVFGFMHHVPGFEQRVSLLLSLVDRLTAGGRLAATFWRFGADPRFQGRLRAFDSSIDAEQVEPGDHLLLWGESESVGRYCHFCDEAELERLIGRLGDAGFTVVDRFRSDGRSGAFNEYVVWSPR